MIDLIKHFSKFTSFENSNSKLILKLEVLRSLQARGMGFYVPFIITYNKGPFVNTDYFHRHFLDSIH